MSEKVREERGLPDQEERRRIVERAALVQEAARSLLAQLDLVEHHSDRKVRFQRQPTVSQTNRWRVAA